MQKKIILIFLVFSVGIIIIYSAFTFLSENLDNWLYDEREPGNAIFPYEADFEEDIFKDKEYMELDRLIYYMDASTGVTLSIDETDYSTYNDAVTFMYEFINSIIMGDSEFYNNCFNDAYIDAVGGKQYPFTMQKLYDIKFCILETGDDTLTGKTYTKLWLDYKIFKNNITLRTDIDSNVCRRQYLTLVKEDNGIYKIQAIHTQIVKPIRTLNIGNAILLVSLILIIVGGIVTAIVLVIINAKKTSKQEKVLSNGMQNQTDVSELIDSDKINSDNS